MIHQSQTFSQAVYISGKSNRINENKIKQEEKPLSPSLFSASESHNYLDKLPPEILLEILRYISIEDLIKVVLSGNHNKDSTLTINDIIGLKRFFEQGSISAIERCRNILVSMETLPESAQEIAKLINENSTVALFIYTNCIKNYTKIKLETFLRLVYFFSKASLNLRDIPCIEQPYLPGMDDFLSEKIHVRKDIDLSFCIFPISRKYRKDPQIDKKYSTINNELTKKICSKPEQNYPKILYTSRSISGVICNEVVKLNDAFLQEWKKLCGKFTTKNLPNYVVKHLGKDFNEKAQREKEQKALEKKQVLFDKEVNSLLNMYIQKNPTATQEQLSEKKLLISANLHREKFEKFREKVTLKLAEDEFYEKKSESNKVHLTN